MWREIQLQALPCLAMWACCDDISSDDDEHNTSNAFLLLCADAFIAPVLLARLTDVDELLVALGGGSPWTPSLSPNRITSSRPGLVEPWS